MTHTFDKAIAALAGKNDVIFGQEGNNAIRGDGTQPVDRATTGCSAAQATTRWSRTTWMVASATTRTSLPPPVAPTDWTTRA